MLDNYLTIKEYAKQVGLSYFTIVNYVKSGKLESVKFAGRYFIKSDAKIKYKAGSKVNQEFAELDS